MKKDLNSISGRVAAAKRAEWQRFLVDRWYRHAFDDSKETDYIPICPICSNAP